MKINRGDIIVGSVFLLIFGVLVIMATGYNRKARTMPLVVGVPGLALAAAHVLRGTILRPRVKEVKEGIAEKAEDSPENGNVAENKKTLAAIGWMVLLICMIWLIGFTIALPLYTLVFMKSRKESWLTSIMVSAVGLGVIYFLFVKGLEMFLYRGLLFQP